MNQLSPEAVIGTRRRGIKRIVLMVVVPLIAAVAGLTLWWSSGGSVSTDDAYVKSDKIMVAPQISGRVAAVAVAENAQVEAGQLLFRIDPEPLRIALAHADADLAEARNEVAALRALYYQRDAELRAAAQTAAWLERELDRQRNLGEVVSRSRLDELQHRQDNARAEYAARRQALSAALQSLGGDPDAPVDDHPKMRAALAARERAALELRYAEVRAPAAGIVTKFDLQPGEWVEAGQPVFGLVAVADSWVEANFKETQLTHVRVGQPAYVTVDTYPGRLLRGRVVGISPATGAEFALLPAQNATGNWVKVVQRLPVRIAIEAGQDVPLLRAGMSASVEIITSAAGPVAQAAE